MELLQQLTRRQLDSLRSIAQIEARAPAASLTEIARVLRVRPPSALAHLGALETHGLIERYRGKSRLTRRGRACLDEYQRHHRVAESLFSRAGLSVDATCAAAREIDLALSHRTVEEICRSEGHPAVCPHGATIAPCTNERGKR